VYAHETVQSARVYEVKPLKHMAFWPQQTGKNRRMAVSISDLPGETPVFDFGSTHCTMLQMDNKVLLTAVLIIVQDPCKKLREVSYPTSNIVCLNILEMFDKFFISLVQC